MPDRVVEAPATDLTVERAAVLAELHRRDGAWMVCNFSAGWSGGLASLVREHRVTVEDEAPAPTPPPPAPSGPPADFVERSGSISLVKGERLSIEKSPLIVAEIS